MQPLHSRAYLHNAASLLYVRECLLFWMHPLAAYRFTTLAMSAWPLCKYTVEDERRGLAGGVYTTTQPCTIFSECQQHQQNNQETYKQCPLWPLLMQSTTQ